MVEPLKLLILGGTAEAAALAEATTAAGHEVWTSLAGATQTPRRPAGRLVLGALGGIDGLTRLLADEGFDRLVDATHPFAETISANAVEAARRAGVPRITLRRPPWTAGIGDRWYGVADLAEALETLPRAAAPEDGRVFVATGRRGLNLLAARAEYSFVVRTIEPVAVLPPGVDVTLVRDRGPFDLAAERGFFTEHAVSAVIAKNAGGTGAEAKIQVARECHIAVLMIDRPPSPPGLWASRVDEVVDWLARPVAEDQALPPVSRP
jgi:precorrin-6A/cobalt-precorrin-6A reductase